MQLTGFEFIDEITCFFLPHQEPRHNTAELQRCFRHTDQKHLKQTVTQRYILIDQSFKATHTDSVGHHAIDKLSFFILLNILSFQNL